MKQALQRRVTNPKFVRVTAILIVGIGCIIMSGQTTIAGEMGQPAGLSPASMESPDSVTVPFTLDHNRMMVDVEFVGPDGIIREARAWVDTGNEYLIVAESLARDLGFDLPEIAGEEHSVELSSPPPPMRLGGLPLRVEGVKTRVYPGSFVRPGVPAETNVPASLLRHDYVVFDYPTRSMTIARNGGLKPGGVGIPCQINAETGLFMVAATIDGDTLQLGIDNGSAGTWVSNSLTTEWTARHPDWAHATGATGSTNFFGFPFESGGVLMRLPVLGLGAIRVEDVAILGLDQRLFDWYSMKSAGPVHGFVGANVLRKFRIEIDFPNKMTYWKPGKSAESNDLDIVGLTLRPELDGSLSIAGVVKREGKTTVEGVQPGDVLVRVDRLETAKATMGAVVDALRGKPGSIRTLTLERDGDQVTVEAEVLRFP